MVQNPVIGSSIPQESAPAVSSEALPNLESMQVEFATLRVAPGTSLPVPENRRPDTQKLRQKLQNFNPRQRDSLHENLLQRVRDAQAAKLSTGVASQSTFGSHVSEQNTSTETKIPGQPVEPPSTHRGSSYGQTVFAQVAPNVGGLQGEGTPLLYPCDVGATVDQFPCMSVAIPSEPQLGVAAEPTYPVVPHTKHQLPERKNISPPGSLPPQSSLNTYPPISEGSSTTFKFIQEPTEYALATEFASKRTSKSRRGSHPTTPGQSRATVKSTRRVDKKLSPPKAEANIIRLTPTGAADPQGREYPPRGHVFNSAAMENQKPAKAAQDGPDDVVYLGSHPLPTTQNTVAPTSSDSSQDPPPPNIKEKLNALKLKKFGDPGFSFFDEFASHMQQGKLFARQNDMIKDGYKAPEQLRGGEPLDPAYDWYRVDLDMLRSSKEDPPAAGESASEHPKIVTLIADGQFCLGAPNDASDGTPIDAIRIKEWMKFLERSEGMFMANHRYTPTEAFKNRAGQLPWFLHQVLEASRADKTSIHYREQILRLQKITIENLLRPEGQEIEKVPDIVCLNGSDCDFFGKHHTTAQMIEVMIPPLNNDHAVHPCPWMPPGQGIKPPPTAAEKAKFDGLFVLDEDGNKVVRPDSQDYAAECIAKKIAETQGDGSDDEETDLGKLAERYFQIPTLRKFGVLDSAPPQTIQKKKKEEERKENEDSDVWMDELFDF
ncbi:hypothetical protein TWF281_002961 [Arthrobotrys megalospora]